MGLCRWLLESVSMWRVFGFVCLIFGIGVDHVVGVWLGVAGVWYLCGEFWSYSLIRRIITATANLKF